MPAWTQQVLPRWRGFNLLDFFAPTSSGDVAEEEIRWIADWGFTFARFPMCYSLWSENGDPAAIHLSFIEKIDRAVNLCIRHGIHVCLAFHRAPGYCVNPHPPESFSLWKHPAAQHAFCEHWKFFAGRYKGIPARHLSFNLVNEPPAPTPEGMTVEDHDRVIRAAVAAIHGADPARLIIADGLRWGNDPLPGLTDLPLAQSCRAYLPFSVTHYKAPWVGGDDFPDPAWPLGWHYGEIWDRSRLEKHYSHWAELASRGIGVHCGEGGVYRHTPRRVQLAWYRDVLEVLASVNIGFALWNLRGPFGVLDTERDDAPMENWYGHQLDTELLALLQT